jgi:hypothetical protein
MYARIKETINLQYHKEKERFVWEEISYQEMEGRAG